MTRRTFRSPLSPARAAALAVAVALAAWGLLVRHLPDEAFWTTDEGNRYLQLRTLERTGSLDLGRIWGGWLSDREGEDFPTAGFHILRQGKRAISFHPPFLAAMTLPLFQRLGAGAIPLWPLVGLLATTALFPFLLAALGLRAPPLGVELLPLVASPLLFYASGFWEQPLCAALGTGGFLALLAATRRESRWIALGGGALLGAAAVLREEGYVLAAAWAVASLLAGRDDRRGTLGRVLAAGAGFVALIAPAWLLQWRLWGAPFGLHARVYGELLPDHSLRGELADAATYLLKWSADPWIAAALAALLGQTLLVGLFSRRGDGRWETASLLLAALGASAAVWLLLRDPQPMQATLSTQGLLPHAPLLVLAALSLRRRLGDAEEGRRTLAWTVVLATLALVWLLHRRGLGLIWGPRHFLPLFPLLLALVALDLEATREGSSTTGGRRGRLAAIALLAAAGVAIQGYGLHLLIGKREATAALLAAVREAPARAVITDQFWLPEELAAAWGEKSFYWVRDDAGLARRLAALAEAGERSALVALSSVRGPISKEARARLEPFVVDRRRVAWSGASFLAIDGLLVRLDAPTRESREGAVRP